MVPTVAMLVQLAFQEKRPACGVVDMCQRVSRALGVESGRIRMFRGCA